MSGVLGWREALAGVGAGGRVGLGEGEKKEEGTHHSTLLLSKVWHWKSPSTYSMLGSFIPYLSTHQQMPRLRPREGLHWGCGQGQAVRMAVPAGGCTLSWPFVFPPQDRLSLPELRGLYPSPGRVWGNDSLGSLTYNLCFM